MGDADVDEASAQVDYLRVYRDEMMISGDDADLLRHAAISFTILSFGFIIKFYHADKGVFDKKPVTILLDLRATITLMYCFDRCRASSGE